MKLLLTSGGIKNNSIRNALIEMLRKPIEASKALCIPTAIYALSGGCEHAWKFINGKEETPMVELGWQSVGVLELTALPSLDPNIWLPALKEADVILVNGGDPLYLNHWMKASGISDLLPTLEVVYVGLSAGSMIMAPRIGDDFVHWQQPEGNDKTLGFIDFAIFPHLNHVMLPENTTEDAIKWAKTMDCKAYAIDDQTAIKVIDDQIEVISEGEWYLYNE
ncbi:MAG: Type 1 glutamine amidotransferase-like domain-containing protein [Clostridia bacterium]|nr:Type 1 glutamine amidotransferase-like domain-containing protein [Clostridia bacterium]